MGARRGNRIAGRDVTGLRRALLAWHDDHRRALPWRLNRDPYRVWVAEVMLQQTRIAVVEPAYDRFMAAFPSIDRLAGADEDDVLAPVVGARLLLARALPAPRRPTTRRGSGDVPERLFRGPGVAGRRCLYRRRGSIDRLWRAARGRRRQRNPSLVPTALPRPAPTRRASRTTRWPEELLARDRPGDWNEAIMELGETICSPKSPDCDRCPIASYCDAHRKDVVDRYPPAKKRRATERVQATMLVVRDADGNVVLERGAFPYLPGDVATARRRKPGGRAQ